MTTLGIAVVAILGLYAVAIVVHWLQQLGIVPHTICSDYQNHTTTYSYYNPVRTVTLTRKRIDADPADPQPTPKERA